MINNQPAATTEALKQTTGPSTRSLSGIQLAALASCAGAVLILSAGFWLIGSWVMLALTALVGLGWWVVLVLRKERLAAVFFTLFVLVAAAGILVALPPAWQLGSVTAALCAWDLGNFAHRLDRVSRVDKRGLLIQRHILRLLAVCVLSLVLGTAALGIRTSMGFIPALLLAALLLSSLIAAITFLRRKIAGK